MKKLGLTSHSISNVFIFVLIGVFAITSTLLTLIGTRIYRRVTTAASITSESQLALSYLVNKVHAADREGGIALDEREGVQVLCLRETLDGVLYETRVYFHKGSLREYFALASDAFAPDEGERLVDARSFTLTREGELLTICIEPAEGMTLSFHVALRSDGKEANAA